MIKIENTLEAKQEIVGGYIQQFMPYTDDVAIICNEETQPKIENKINQLKNDNKRKELSKDERFRRCSRTNSENEFTRS